MKNKTCEDCTHFFVCGIKPHIDYTMKTEAGEKHCMDFSDRRLMFDVGDTVYVIEPPTKLGLPWEIAAHTIKAIYLTSNTEYITEDGWFFDDEMIGDVVFATNALAQAHHNSIFDTE